MQSDKGMLASGGERGYPGPEVVLAHLFGADGERGHQLGGAVGTGGLVVGLISVPPTHDLLIVEEGVAGGALAARAQFHIQAGGGVTVVWRVIPATVCAPILTYIDTQILDPKCKLAPSL